MRGYWYMAYTSIAFPSSHGQQVVSTGGCVTKEHPIALVSRWNRKPEQFGRVVLTFYRPLGEDEIAELGMSGVAASDVDFSFATIQLR